MVLGFRQSLKLTLGSVALCLALSTNAAAQAPQGTQPPPAAQPPPSQAAPKPEDAIRLKEDVQVTATRSAVDKEMSPASSSVVLREDLERRNVVAVDQALTTEEGVYAYRARGITDNEVGVGMRGFSGRGNGQSRVLILLDGQPLNNGYSGGVNWTSIWRGIARGLDAASRLGPSAGSESADVNRCAAAAPSVPGVLLVDAEGMAGGRLGQPLHEHVAAAGEAEGPAADEHIALLLGPTPHIHPERLGANGGVGNKRKTMAQTVGWYNIVAASDTSEQYFELRARLARYAAQSDAKLRADAEPLIRSEVVRTGIDRALSLDAAQVRFDDLLPRVQGLLDELDRALAPYGSKILGDPPTGKALADMVTAMAGRDLRKTLEPLTASPATAARALVAAVVAGRPGAARGVSRGVWSIERSGGSAVGAHTNLRRTPPDGPS